MWRKGWRDSLWSELDQPWDLIVIGGGVTGAGILREASRAGLKALLVEGHDFASGTSSRSSKLVHGGLRYLSNLQIKVTLDSVRERDRLLREGRGLIEPLGNVIVGYRHDRPPLWVFGAGLMVYDTLALKWAHKRQTAAQLTQLCPLLNTEQLAGGYHYFDAQTDDARLVLRVILEAVRAGGAALNYACVEGLLRDRAGQVHGIQLRDQVGGRLQEVRAPVVINAAGAWADELRGHVDAEPQLRPLRGSHLFFPWDKLPLTQMISFMHPVDHRPVFAYPWEGVTLVGTTDVDHGGAVPTDPSLSLHEVEYLMQAVSHAFKPLNLGLNDVQATLSGVRAVVNTGQADPSKESREFVLWDEHGLLTITGGKLTTFRLMAHDALRAVRKRLPDHPRFNAKERVLDPIEISPIDQLDPIAQARLFGRYGADTPELLNAAQADELQPIGSSPARWAELRWAARAEGVVHLDDLLLRRVRLGLIAPQGGLPLMDRIRAIAQPELGWDDERWHVEAMNYMRLWKESYSIHSGHLRHERGIVEDEARRTVSTKQPEPQTKLLYKDEVYAIIGAAIEVHRELGPGFLEAVYQEALEIELEERKVPFEPQKPLTIFYKKRRLKKEYIADAICYDKIIVELKALDKLSGREKAQLLNYLKATGLRVGLLINFGSDGTLEWERLIR